MIKRSSAKNIPSIVNSATSEHQTAAEGIRRDKPVTDVACVSDSCNLEMMNDRTLALRKPLVLKSLDEDLSVLLNDKKHVLEYVRFRSRFYVREGSNLQNMMMNTILRYTKYDGTVSDMLAYDGNEIFDLSEVDGFSTQTGTVLTDVKVYPKKLAAFYDPSLATYFADDTVSRYLYIYKEDENWIVEIVNPEMNTITGDVSSATNFNPNLLLDNPYTLRDLYNYGSISCTGIMAYTDKHATYGEDTLTLIEKLSYNINIGNGLFELKYIPNSKSILLVAQRTMSFVNPTQFKESSESQSEDFYVEYVSLSFQVAYTTGTQSEAVPLPSFITVTVDVPKIIPMGYCIILNANKSILGLSGVQNAFCRTESYVYVYNDNVSIDNVLDSKYKRYSLSDMSFTTHPESYIKLSYNNGAFSCDIPDIPSNIDKVTIDMGNMTEDIARNAAVKRISVKTSYVITESTTIKVWCWKTMSGLSNYASPVKLVTESVHPDEYALIDALPKNIDSDAQVLLKAWMTLPSSIDTAEYFALWESSSDMGVTWDSVPYFENQHVSELVNVPVQSYESDESIDRIGTYTEYKTMVKYSATSNNDTLDTRLDALPVKGENALKQHRFSIYRYDQHKADVMQDTTYLSYAAKSSEMYKVAKTEKGVYRISGISTLYAVIEASHLDVIHVYYGATDDFDSIVSNDDCINLLKEHTATPGTNYIPINLEDIHFDTDLSKAHLVKLLIKVNGTVHSEHYIIYDRIFNNTSFSELQIINENTTYECYEATEGATLVRTIQSNLGSVTGSSSLGFAIRYRFTCTVKNMSNVYRPIHVYVEPNAPGTSSNVAYVGASAITSTPRDVIGGKFTELFNARDTKSIDYVSLNFDKSVKDYVYFGGDAYALKSGSASLSDIAKAGTYSDTEKRYCCIGYSQLYKDSKLKLLKDCMHTVCLPPNSETPLTFEMYLSIAGSGTFRNVFADMFCGLVIDDAYTKRFCVNKPAYREYDRVYTGPNSSVSRLALGQYLEDICNSAILDQAYEYSGKLLSNYDAIAKDIAIAQASRKAVLLSQKVFVPNIADSQTVLMPDNVPDVTSGRTMFYGNQIFTYGIPGHEHEIYISDIDSFITPMYNTLDNPNGHSVKKIVPWRNYMLIFTEYNVCLAAYDTSTATYNTKVLTTTVGIPDIDSDTVATMLNSVIFKSHSKVYKLVPNLYSANDSVMNIACISDPIEGLLTDSDKPNFGFATDDSYYLFIPKESHTDMFCYDYEKKTWTRHSYPVCLTGYDYVSVDDIMLRSKGKTFHFDKTLQELGLASDFADIMRYGDILSARFAAILDECDRIGYSTAEVTPIEFMLDTGHRSGTYTIEKQFVESKMLLATMSTTDNKFPFAIDIYTDDIRPMKVHMDVTTDSPFWADNPTIDILSTEFTTEDAKRAGTLRQLFVKYAGRGKSIRHILHGESVSRFKFYAIDVRSKVLPVKQ